MSKTPSSSARRPSAQSKATPNASRSSGIIGISSKIEPQDPVTSSNSILYADESKQFFTSVQLNPRRDVFMNNSDAIISQPQWYEKDGDNEWCIKVGDFACIESQNVDARRKRCSPGKAAASASPFAVPWRPCQILALFRDRIPKKLTTKKIFGQLRVEVRWFYRYEDLDKRNRHYEKAGSGSTVANLLEEVFETDHVAVLDASLLLGRLVIHDNADSDISGDSVMHPVPTVEQYCHRYYLHVEQDVIEIFERDNSLIRGLDCSEILQYKNTRKITCKFLGLSDPDCNDDDIGSDASVAIPKPAANIQYKEQLVAYYTSCTLTHPWSNLTHGKIVCSQPRRHSFPKWKLCVGDVVAVHCDESTPASDVDAIHGRDKWYPYRVPWSHGQVIAIFRDIDKSTLSQDSSASQSVPPASLYCEIRWFPRISEAQAECQDTQKIHDHLRDISNNTKRMTEEILEGKQTLIIDCCSLLGPVSVEDESTDPTVLFLPRNQRRVSDFISCDDKGKPHIGRTQIEFDPTLRVHRGIDASKRFKNGVQKDNVLNEVLRVRKERTEQMIQHDEFHPQCVKDSRASEVVCGDIAAEKVAFHNSPFRKRQLFSNDSNEDTSNGKRIRLPSTSRPIEAVSHHSRPSDNLVIKRISCNGQPFHVDLSAYKSFYKEMDIVPYDERFSCSGVIINEAGEIWKVKLGDTIIVETEHDSKLFATVNFPFTVPWAPAEVVSIYRLHKDKESCVRFNRHNEQNKMSADSMGEIMLEIRWFYRPWEIPGACKKKPETINGDELDEVFETDQIDVCSADSILSPMQLHDIHMSSTVPNRMLGMPLIHFHCSRFWSIHRRTFVPSGSMSNRVLRGRMYSSHKAAFSALERSANCPTDASVVGETSWKEDFQAAIQKLSLAAAAQDAQDKGVVLACRENERQKIAHFLRKAISGLVHSRGDEEEETKHLKSSLFIAGPPGTGKTASVRSVIKDLEKEQHEGLLPEFNFITLNGMELRHPFDAYSRFWEALSGPRKERLSAGAAVCELENYFCGDQKGGCSDSNSEEDDTRNVDVARVTDRPITVLLLDEIDYLITKKETLVYNFFDWPLRATTARLVVVAISNTINLPEKLSTRVQSRIGGDRCHFRSYNVQDTITILKTRLGMLGSGDANHVFEEDAINFAARKTANLSGDIRKAFHMCKVAAEAVLEEYISGKRQIPEGSRPLVRIADVQKGSRDMFTSVVLKAVSCSTDYEALLLISLGALKRDKVESFDIKDLLTKIESIANASGEERYMNARLSFSDLLGIVNRLGDAGVIKLSFHNSSPWPSISMSLHSYEILASYRDTRHKKLSEKHLANQGLFA